MIKLIPINADSAPEALGGYTQALAVEGASRLLFISGQIPQTREGTVPEGFEAQCRLVWSNLLAAVREAGLEVSSLVKVTTFLSDRRYAEANGAIRREVLGAHTPALTVIIAEIFDSAWLLEIEAVAAG
ncbi:RidA family protein [Nonomuraea guangzhouensis]|uniref:RidA family protein n=1 Tax=Nonomuraea guangzhouensis TaxID=1291555 RepID=A0ABW4GYC0_9ACTN|nr:RidA family protein [Nonomuraea guangzhouensis]